MASLILALEHKEPLDEVVYCEVMFDRRTSGEVPEQFAPRNGCFFCPNAKWKELRHLYDHHPSLWGRLLKLQALPEKVTERFTRELRFDEIDAMFRMEDAQLDLLSEKEIIPYDYERIRSNHESI